MMRRSRLSFFLRNMIDTNPKPTGIKTMNRKAVNITAMTVRGIVFPLLAMAVYFIFTWVEPNSGIDDYFTYTISKFLLTQISRVTGLVGFSAAELILLPLVAAVNLGLLINGVIHLYRRRFPEFFESVTKLIRNASVLIILFYVLWGINYKALGVRYLLNLETTTHSQNDLVDLSRLLIRDAKNQRTAVSGFNGSTSNGDSSFRANLSIDELSELGNQAYDQLGISQLKEPNTRVKPVLFSEYMNYTGISGIFIPFTAESNINAKQNDLLLPSSILHEMAHLKGVASEDEANLIAYLVSQKSADSRLQYSGTMLALIHSMNQLFEDDRAVHGSLLDSYSPAMKADLAAYNRFWSGYEGPAMEKAEAVNDSYLKMNDQGGVSDYQGIVLLLLDYFKGLEEN